MNKKIIVIVFGFIIVMTSPCIFSCNSNKQKINSKLLLRVDGEKHYAVWNSSNGEKDSSMKIHISDVKNNSRIILGFNSPNGTKALVVIGDKGFNVLANANNLLTNAFDEYGELEDDYSIQAVEFDFDKDGNNEIVLAIGNFLTELGIYIFKYNQNNFIQIGFIKGESCALILTDGVVKTFTRNKVFQDKYIWKANKFIKIK